MGSAYGGTREMRPGADPRGSSREMPQRCGTPRRSDAIVGSVRATRLLGVPLALLLASCGSAPSGVAPAASASLVSSVDASATPAGWIAIDYGDAQLSVPLSWQVSYGEGACSSAVPGVLAVAPPARQRLWCPGTTWRVPSQAWVAPTRLMTVGPAGRVLARLAVDKVVVHGIALFRVPPTYAGQRVAYWAPSLGVEITSRGVGTWRILRTLTHSPRTVVLARGTAPAAPASWRHVSIDGLSFAAPSSWRTWRTPDSGSCGSTVALGDRGIFRGSRTYVEPDDPMVVIDTDTVLSVPACPYLDPEAAPGDGVVIETGSRVDPNPPGPIGARRLRLGAVTASVNGASPYDVLSLSVLVPGRSMPIEVQIGMGGDGWLARVILHSLRSSAPRGPTTPSSP